MPASTQNDLRAGRGIGADFWNVPNQLSTLRLILSIVLFVVLSLPRFHFLGVDQYLWSLALFAIAAGTDWVDGYWARKFGQVTMLGRILDPFVDKIIICGTFILLGAAQHLGSGVAAWMAVVIVGRELLVTALRSFLEQQGTDFSAKMSGKLKMVLQCLAAGTSLFRLSYGEQVVPDWLTLLLNVSVWSAVVMTVYSGVGYVVTALKMLRRE